MPKRDLNVVPERGLNVVPERDLNAVPEQDLRLMFGSPIWVQVLIRALDPALPLL